MRSENSVKFLVPGNPLPKQSVRFTRRGSYTPERIRVWEEVVALKALEAMGRYGPFEFPIKATLVFLRDNKRRVDLGNLEKPVLDALNQICYLDDSQVKELHLYLSYNKQHPGVHITIEECTWQIGSYPPELIEGIA